MTKENKNSVGRPSEYSTAEELQLRVDDYFDHPPRLRKVVVGRKDSQQVIELPIFTISGLSLFLGFASRQSFYDLEKQEKFSYTIKKARTRIEQEYEEQIHLGNTCAIFALKNFGWTDKQEVEHSGSITLKVDNAQSFLNEAELESARNAIVNRN